MHDDAELAVVGVGGARVEVRDLGKGQRGKQNKAQPRDGR